MRHLLLTILLVGCYSNPCPVANDGVPPDVTLVDGITYDAPVADAPTGPCPVNPYLRDDDFSMAVLTDPIELRPGTETSIVVCVQRGARFVEPVLLSAAWAPEHVQIEVRENRVEDADGITVLRVRTASLEDTGGASPGEYRAARIPIQGSSGFDQWTTIVLGFTVGPADH